MKSIKFTEQELFRINTALYECRSRESKTLKRKQLPKNVEIYIRNIVSTLDGIIDKFEEIEPDIEYKSTNN